MRSQAVLSLLFLLVALVACKRSAADDPAGKCAVLESELGDGRALLAEAEAIKERLMKARTPKQAVSAMESASAFYAKIAGSFLRADAVDPAVSPSLDGNARDFEMLSAMIDSAVTNAMGGHRESLQAQLKLIEQRARSAEKALKKLSRTCGF